MYTLAYFINKENNLKEKIQILSNNTGFIIRLFNRTLKYTLLENKSFFIEDYYMDKETKQITNTYIDFIEGKAYAEWIDFIYT
jgi:hypothetical protein